MACCSGVRIRSWTKTINWPSQRGHWNFLIWKSGATAGTKMPTEETKCLHMCFTSNGFTTLFENPLARGLSNKVGGRVLINLRPQAGDLLTPWPPTWLGRPFAKGFSINVMKSPSSWDLELPWHCKVHRNPHARGLPSKVGVTGVNKLPAYGQRIFDQCYGGVNF
jgi:hypothetical protein